MRTRRETLLDLLGLGVVGQDQGVQVALGSDLELDLFLLLGAAGNGDGGALDASGWRVCVSLSIACNAQGHHVCCEFEVSIGASAGLLRWKCALSSRSRPRVPRFFHLLHDAWNCIRVSYT